MRIRENLNRTSFLRMNVMGKWRRGHTEEAKQKMREKKLGRKVDAATRAKISATLRSKWKLIRELEATA